MRIFSLRSPLPTWLLRSAASAALAELAADLVRAFLRAEFDGGERYVRRLKKVTQMERELHE